MSIARLHSQRDRRTHASLGPGLRQGDRRHAASQQIPA
jgi:hypothetical protein